MCYIPYDGAHLLCGAGRFSFQSMSRDLVYTVGACGLPTAWWGTASLMHPFSFQMCKLRSPNDFLPVQCLPPRMEGIPWLPTCRHSRLHEPGQSKRDTIFKVPRENWFLHVYLPSFCAHTGLCSLTLQELLFLV